MGHGAGDRVLLRVFFLGTCASADGPRSENELLARAFRRLAEYDETVTDLRAGLEDESAGRLRPLRDVDAELRQRWNPASTMTREARLTEHAIQQLQAGYEWHAERSSELAANCYSTWRPAGCDIR